MAEGGISNKQAFIYLGITFACFAVLYPSLFHPLVRGVLKWGRVENDTKNEPPLPIPEMVKRGQTKQEPSRPPMRRGAPPSPHPEASQGATGQSQSSGKGGVVGFVLPVYAIGIVVYLVYVVSKVYLGGGNKTKKLEETDVYETLQKKLSAIDFERVLKGDDTAAMEELTALADQLRHYRQQATGSDTKQTKKHLQQSSGEGDIQLDGCAEDSADCDAETTISAAAEPNDEQYSLDDLLEQSDHLSVLSSLETQKLQRKLLEAEAKMARIAEALRKATARSEQLVSSCEDTASFSKEDLDTVVDDVQRSPDSSRPQTMCEGERDSSDSDDEIIDPVETITADPEIHTAHSSNFESGVRHRAITRDHED